MAGLHTKAQRQKSVSKAVDEAESRIRIEMFGFGIERVCVTVHKKQLLLENGQLQNR